MPAMGAGGPVELAAEVAIVLLPAVPFARLAAEPGVRRRFRAFPRVQSLLLGSLAVYAAAVAVLVVAVPALLRPAAGLAVVVVLAERWRARSGYGRRRGLPPGRMPLAAVGPWREQAFYARQAARHGPVFKYRHFVYPAVGVVGLKRGADLLRKHAASLAVPPAPFTSLVSGGFIRYLEQDRHRSVTSVLRAVMSPRVVDACGPALEAEARIALERLAAAGTRVDPRATLDRLTLNCLMRAFYGLSPGPPLDRLEALYEIADYRRLARTGRTHAAVALTEIMHQVRDLATAESTSAARPSFVSELARLYPDLLDDEAVLGNMAYMLHTARLDVGGLLDWVVWTLGGQPAWQTRLADEVRACPEGPRPGGLADRIVRETLRLEQSEFLFRRATARIDWEGFTIPAGWWVRICVRESHRSPDAFVDPDRFDPDRFLEEPARSLYAPFGVYSQLCLGQQLALSIGRTLVYELAWAYELAVVDDGPVEFNGFHWGPSSRFRVRLTPRTGTTPVVSAEAMSLPAPT